MSYSAVGGNDTILGGDIASDEIHGGAGDDFIRAFATSPEDATAADRLFGGPGDDVVIGGNGADVIDGGRGNDFLTGNDGADVFIFRNNGSGEDLVSDFDPSEDVAQLVGFEEGFDALAALSPSRRHRPRSRRRQQRAVRGPDPGRVQRR